MDPLTGFALFLVGQVALPDAYSRGVDRVLHRSNARRLTKDVEKAAGQHTGRRYRQWYEREETWTALVVQGEASYEALVDSLERTLAKRLWGSARPSAKLSHPFRTVGGVGAASRRLGRKIGRVRT